MKRLFLALLALGAVSVGVLFALADRSPGEPPPELVEDGRFQWTPPQGPKNPAFYRNADQAPGAPPEGPGEGTERVERARQAEQIDAPGLGEVFEDGTGRGGGGQGIGRLGDGFDGGLKQGGKGRSLSAPAAPATTIHLEALAIEGEPQEPLADAPPSGRRITRLGERSLGKEVHLKTLEVGYVADLKDKNKLKDLGELDGAEDLEGQDQDKNQWGAARENRAMPIDLSSLKLDGQGQALGAPEDRPERFLPRMCYFENTYLGGNAAHQERLRRLEADLADSPHRLATLEPQPFDAPEDAGLRLTATLDHTHLDRPGRVMLQVGLQGSRRFGWRRPPLDIVLLVDAGSSEALVPAADALLKRLGPQDRLAIVQAGEGEPVVGLADRRTVRTALARHTERVGGSADDVLLEHALTTAGRLLTGADDGARVPGTRTLVVVTGSGRESRIQSTRAQVQALAEQGVVTSVVALSTAHDAGWWSVASAGNGNLHRAQGTAGLGEVMEAELASLARVIARLLRVNIRLAPGVEGVRILGSRVLGQAEVREVKAREVATDRNLSRALGVKSDRGEDDDGIQTVIPYFYGGDSHVILVELWVDGPGAVAEISLKYKDMVNLENATARTSVALTARPRPEALATQVLRNLHGFDFAAALKEAAALAEQGESGRAQALLRARAQTDADRRLGEAFIALMQRTPRTDLVSAALALAADRRIGASP